MGAVGCGFISMYHKMMSKRSCAHVFARYYCKRRHSPRRSSPGWHVAGLLALRNTNSGGAPGADPPVRPCARPRRERGQERAAPWPAHVRTGRGSGWNGVARSRGFRSMWWNRRSRSDPSQRTRAVRRATPGSRTAMRERTQNELEYCKPFILSTVAIGPGSAIKSGWGAVPGLIFGISSDF